jgi:hypothetical protein
MISIASPNSRQQKSIKTGLSKLKTIMKETKPKAYRLQSITGNRFALSIVFCLKQI